MRRIDLLGLRRLGFFCAPPLGEREEELGPYRKNRQYLNELGEATKNDSQVRLEVFEELKRLAGHFFENAPAGSFANNFICRAAIELATSGEVPFLIDMLFWHSVLNHRDNSFIAILLEGIKEKGYAEDAEALLCFHQELGKPQRYYYSEGDNKLVPFPGMVRLREKVMEIIRICRGRGPKESEAARIEGGSV